MKQIVADLMYDEVNTTNINFTVFNLIKIINVDLR